MNKTTKFLSFSLSMLGLITACGNPASTGGGQSPGSPRPPADQPNRTVAANKPAENSSKTVTNTANPIDEIPKFPNGESYQSVRKKMLNAGWSPFRSKDADECRGDDERCRDYPEMESCAGTGLSNCRYLWKKNGRVLAIFTIGETPVYDGQELQEPQTQSETDKNDSGWRGGAVVHTPPSNVRESPAGKALCVIREKKTITVEGSTGIRDENGEWIRTGACGRPGVIHSSQIKMGNHRF